MSDAKSRRYAAGSIDGVKSFTRPRRLGRGVDAMSKGPGIYLFKAHRSRSPHCLVPYCAPNADNRNNARPKERSLL